MIVSYGTMNLKVYYLFLSPIDMQLTVIILNEGGCYRNNFFYNQDLIEVNYKIFLNVFLLSGLSRFVSNSQFK